MSITDHLLNLLAGRFHVPAGALDYFRASGRLARPAETTLPFPAELVPIGARLVLRGWANETFFPANLDWVLPYWAERQFDPRDPAFTPRGFNLYTINYTHRDWTSIGNLDRAREALVDPRGLITPWFDGWSLDTWLFADGKLFAPSRLEASRVEQTLYENLPIVVTAFDAAGLRVQMEAFACEESPAQGREAGEWAVQQITIENSGPSPRRATLLVALRPFNGEGVSLVKQIEYRDAPDGGGVWLVNGALGVSLPRPDGIACSDYAAGDVALALPALNGQMRVQDQTGMATALAAYQLDLRAGESRRLAVRMPLQGEVLDEDDPALLAPVAFLAPAATLRTGVISTWRETLAQGMRVRLPDEKLQNAFEANKAFLLLLHDGDSITPGPFTYHQFWFRDAAYMLNALDKLGYHAQARQVIEQFPRYMDKDGYLRATESEWDSNGAAIWSMVEHARLSGDKELVARDYWPLLRMASWINSKRRKTLDRGRDKAHAPHYGLLPPGPSAEHLGPSDYYYWDDFWGLAGLREAARAAEWVGQTQDAARLRANFQSFSADVDASLATAAARLGRHAMPASPYRRLESGMIGNLAALYPLRLFEPDDPRIVDTIAALKETAWLQDAYFSHVGHSALGTYLSLHVAECLLFRRDPEAWRIIRWVLDLASPTFTWAEGLHPITRHGAMGDGHHGWALADFLLAVRNALLYEEGDHLVITPVLPQEWTVENTVIKVEDAATYFGKVSFTIAFGERTGTLVVDADWRTAPAYVEWSLPFAPREAGGEIEGVDVVGNSVRLPRGARRVVVMW